MNTNEEVYEKLDDIEKQCDEVIEALEKANNSWLSYIYDFVVKAFSLVVLFSSVYAALFVSASSATVLALLFLITWFLYILKQFSVSVAKGFANSRADEAKKIAKYKRLK